MNKKLVAIAVVAALVPAAAMAEVTVYGRGHLTIDANSGNADNGTGTKNGLNLTSNSSRIGFKGAEELANGMKGVFQFETTVDVQGGTNQSMFGGQRDTYLGVAGDFGTMIAGRLPLANQWAYDANFFGDKVGDAANFTGGGFGKLNGALAGLLDVPGRVNRAIAYVSPSLGGVTVLAAYVPNTAQSVLGTQDALGKAASYTLRASYDSNNIFAAANVASISGISAATTAVKDAKVTITSLAGGYDFGMAKVRAQLVNSAANDTAVGTPGVDAKQTVIAVGGQVKLNDDDTVSLQFAKAQEAKLGGATVTDSGATLLAVGYDHNLSKNTTVYAAYAKVSNGKAAQFSATGYGHGGVGVPGNDAAGNAASPSALSVGLIRNF